jgi:hypothetical protein
MTEDVDYWYQGRPVLIVGTNSRGGEIWIGPTPVLDLGQEIEEESVKPSFPFSFPSGGFPTGFPFR